MLSLKSILTAGLGFAPLLHGAPTSSVPIANILGSQGILCEILDLLYPNRTFFPGSVEYTYETQTGKMLIIMSWHIRSNNSQSTGQQLFMRDLPVFLCRRTLNKFQALW